MPQPIHELAQVAALAPELEQPAEHEYLKPIPSGSQTELRPQPRVWRRAMEAIAERASRAVAIQGRLRVLAATAAHAVRFRQTPVSWYVV
jgi:hypothetical protein